MNRGGCRLSIDKYGRRINCERKSRLSRREDEVQREPMSNKAGLEGTDERGEGKGIKWSDVGPRKHAVMRRPGKKELYRSWVAVT